MKNSTSSTNSQAPTLVTPPATSLDLSLASLLWSERPNAHRIMIALELRGTLPEGRTLPLGKYDARGYALSNAQLAAHIEGRATYSAPLASSAGTARALALDIDSGGRAALRRALDFASAAGLWAIAIYSPGHDHDGGYLWAFFDQDAPGDQVAALGAQIAELAQVQAEIMPAGKKAARLPFGVHLDTGRRGQMITTEGEIYDLDETGNVERAVRLCEARGRNKTALLPPLAEKAPRSAAQPALGPGESPIAAYNRAATVDQVVSLLESMPGYSEHKRRGGRVLVRCGCGQHSREKNPPAVYVEQGRNGKVLVNSYSTDCRWYAGRGYYDAFEVYREVQGLSARDAASQLARERSPRCEEPEPRGSSRNDRHAPAGAAPARPEGATNAGAFIPDAPHRQAEPPPPPPEGLAQGRTGRERLLNALRMHTSRGGDCLASEAQLSRTASLCERYTRILLRQLARDGEISEHRRAGQSTARRVLVHVPDGGGIFFNKQIPNMHVHDSESRVRHDPAWEKEGCPPAAPALLPGGTHDEIAADEARIVAHRRAQAEADQRESMLQLVRDLAEIAGVTLGELPTDLGELEQLAEQMLVQSDQGEAELVTIGHTEGEAELVTIGHTEGEAVYFEGGASFDPVAPRPELPQRLAREGFDALAQWYDWCEAHAPPPDSREPSAPEPPEPEPLRRGPPRNAERRAAYFKLLGAAKHARSAKQRAWLRGQAAALEELYTAAEWEEAQARPRQLAQARPGSPGLVPQPQPQLELWGTAEGEPSFSHALAGPVSCAD